ncbi:unnamed protein product [Discosporangium mesarthrocarpum]
MVVDGRGRFMSQRRCPKMALISPSLPKVMNEPLLLSAPGLPTLEVPVLQAKRPGKGGGGEVVDVGIWRDTCVAVDQGEDAATWLSDFLEMEGLRLVRMQDGFVRPTDPSYGRGFQTGFADGFPMLLTSEESLQELNSRMDEREAVGMERFRPNLVVRGWGPFGEDRWSEIQVGGLRMRVVKPCERCQVPTINQETLEKREEPRATLSKFRTGAQLGLWKQSWAEGLFFGQNVLHEAQGMIRVGDRVEVVRVSTLGKAPKKALLSEIASSKAD